MSPPLLSLEHVTARAGTIPFGPFHLSVKHGERIAILGPSGAGKSTLLRIISKELRTTSGHIRFDNLPLHQWPLSDLSQRRAVLPQSHEVAFGLETDLVIRLGRIARMHDPKLNSIIQLAAELACCDHLLGRRFDTLSGGEKARIHLARVFAQLWDVNNGMVLVDEPIAALDPGLQFDLMDAIATFTIARNHSVLAVLHDINHALAGFERLLLIKNGQLIGDHACTPAVIPHLEALYDIALETVASSSGELMVKPTRKKHMRKVPV